MEFWERYLVALLVVAVMLAALSLLGRVLQRIRRTKGSHLIEIVESAMLSPQAWLHVVRIGSRYLVVGAAREGVNALAEIDGPERVDSVPTRT